MSLKKDNKAQTGFSKISIGLASPEEILENSSGVFSASASSVL